MTDGTTLTPAKIAAILAENPLAPMHRGPCGQSAHVLAARDRHNSLAGAYNRVRSVLADSIYEEEAEELQRHLIRALLSLAQALGRKISTPLPGGE